MLWFALLVAMLLAIALLLVLPPLLGLAGHTGDAEADRLRAQTVLRLLREQLAELQSRWTSAEIGEEEYCRARDELQRRALEEGQMTAEASVDARPARSLAMLLAAGIPAGVMLVYLWLGAPAGLGVDRPVSRVAESHLAPEQLNHLVGELAARLENEPDDPAAWMMLARSHAALGDPHSVSETWARLGQSAPRHAGVLSEWAKVLAAAQGGTYEGEPRRLIRAALRVSPNHAEALHLAARVSHDRGEYAVAATLWERLLTQIPSSAPAHAVISEYLDRALAGRDIDSELPVQVAPAGRPVWMNGDGETAELRLRGTVRLSSALEDRVRPEDTVFVYARPVAGGMPVVALRYSVAQLPADFDFADGVRMSDGPLPARLVVAARVTSDGDARPQAGDLEGVSVEVPATASDVQVLINRVRE